MVTKLLCVLGLHRWRLHKRTLAYSDDRSEVWQVFEYCERCRKPRTWYDDGE
jgi:hypothetical protein